MNLREQLNCLNDNDYNTTHLREKLEALFQSQRNYDVFNENFFSDNPIAFTEAEQEHIALINERGDETVINADDLHALKNKLAPYYDRFINEVITHYESATLDDGAIVSNIEPVS